jgi:hypothetical protein
MITAVGTRSNVSFDPRILPNVQSWVRGDIEVDPVLWKSATGNNVFEYTSVFADATTPTLITVGRHKGISFDGVKNGMISRAGYNLANPYSIFMVCEVAAFNLFHFLLVGNGVGNIPQIYLDNPNPSVNMQQAAPLDGTAVGITLNKPFILGTVFNAASSGLYLYQSGVNTFQVNTLTSGTMNDKLTLACAANPLIQFAASMTIFETIVLSSAVPPVDAQTMIQGLVGYYSDIL